MVDLTEIETLRQILFYWGLEEENRELFFMPSIPEEFIEGTQISANNDTNMKDIRYFISNYQRPCTTNIERGEDYGCRV